MGDRGAVGSVGNVVMEICLCDCSFLQAGPLKIEIRPMQRQALMMPPSRCIERIHDVVSWTSPILHARGRLDAIQ